MRPPEHLLRELGLASSDLVNVEGGRSGFAWRVRSVAQPAIVRFSPSAREQDSRLAAMVAAGEAGIPVPRVLGHVTDETGAVTLLDWLPGSPLATVLCTSPSQADACGRRFGRLHWQLHQVTVPSRVSRVFEEPVPRPNDTSASTDPEPAADSLLHLDWHPYNVLADADGAITGVIDWDNARRGDPGLDLARTWLMLTADPGLLELPDELRAVLPAFVEAWAEGYGLGDGEVGERHRRWAATVMLREWSDRPLGQPNALEPLRRIVED